MKNQVNHLSGNTFIAVYDSYMNICDKNFSAAILLSLLEKKTDSGSRPVLWTHQEVIDASNGILTDYSIRQAIEILSKNKSVTIRRQQGLAPEYTFNASTINGLIEDLYEPKPDPININNKPPATTNEQEVTITLKINSNGRIAVKQG